MIYRGGATVVKPLLIQHKNEKENITGTITVVLGYLDYIPKKPNGKNQIDSVQVFGNNGQVHRSEEYHRNVWILCRLYILGSEFSHSEISYSSDLSQGNHKPQNLQQ